MTRLIARPDLKVAWWGPMGWGLIVVESLFLLYLWLSRIGQDQVSHYVRNREQILGIEGQHQSPVLPLLVINALVVAALWTAYRGTKSFRGTEARFMGLTALATAVVFALISWNAYRLVKMYPALEVSEVYVRSPVGTYEKILP